jgi:hypothetical protein
MAKRKAQAAKQEDRAPEENEPETGQPAKQKPVWEYILGGIKGSVWEQQGQYGPWLTYTTTRLFEGDDEKLKSARSFKKTDAGNHKMIVDLCFRKMIQLEA